MDIGDVAAQNYQDTVRYFLDGKYMKVLESRQISPIFSCIQDPTLSAVDTIKSGILQFTSETLISERAKLVLLAGASCLQLFVQNNWTGPPTTDDPILLLSKVWQTEGGREKLKAEIANELIIDGEAVYDKCNHILYFYLAKVILLDCKDTFQLVKSFDVWLLRLLIVYQELLNERSPTIKQIAQEIIAKIETSDKIEFDNKENRLEFLLAAGYLSYYFYEPSQAKQLFDKAKELSGLNIELTGALGKRTRFQQTDKAQLVLKVSRSENTTDVPTNIITETPSEMPKDLSLDDDTILNKIAFTNPEEVASTAVSAIEEAVILGLGHDHRRNHEGQGKIVEEEMLAFMNCVLEQPRSWAVQTQALLTRSKWEWESSRRVQRSVMQLEELVTQCSRPSENPAARLAWVCAVNLPPRWKIECDLGALLMKIGAHSAALEVFERLQSWDDVIRCYQTLGKKEKAEKLIREEIAKQETPVLYCYLGEVLNDPQYFHKAWELSNGKNARSQRLLGLFYMSKQKFEESLPYFENSLSINPLQVGVWFSYGCAAIASKRYDVAAKAFRRCVNLTTDNFEAWNNLATAYIRSNQKPRAFLTLQEAIKCAYENWRIWENYLLVATDVGEFGEVIKAYHRMLDLKHKHEDTQVLEVLVHSINDGVKDSQGQPAGAHRKNALELFGRITSKISNNADIWRLYSQLVSGQDEDMSVEDHQKALQLLQKSHRCVTQAPKWEKNITSCLDIICQSCQLSKAYLDTVQRLTESAQQLQLLSSCKLMLRGVLAKVSQQHQDGVSNQLPEDLQGPVEQLSLALEKVTSQIDALKQS